MQYLIIILISLLSNQFVNAEDNSKIELEKTTVVAVANKQERLITDIIGAVTVINSDEISATNVSVNQTTY